MVIVKLMASTPSTPTKAPFQRHNELNANDLFGMQACIVGYETVYALPGHRRSLKRLL
jgi:hypothetical protein